MGRKELEHFYIGDSYGGNQDWFHSLMMRKGGCAAETACDSSLYFALHKGVEGVYPFDPHNLTKSKYVVFAHRMEKYLWPRMSGVDKLDIFIDGYAKYLKDRGVHCIDMKAFDGSEPYEKAADVLIQQIDAGYPVPALILRHKEPALKDYVWHWFLINGYDQDDETGTILVKAVTYSKYEWLDLRILWDTGYDNKGGLVLFEIKQPTGEE